MITGLLPLSYIDLKNKSIVLYTVCLIVVTVSDMFFYIDFKTEVANIHKIVSKFSCLIFYLNNCIIFLSWITFVLFYNVFENHLQFMYCFVLNHCV